MKENEISDVTRQQIADEVILNRVAYCGKLNEPEFLSRLFDLKKLSSRDYRYKNAYDDIYQHTVNNDDWSGDWIYSDTRINMLHCADELYLKFLAETIHPRVRSNMEECLKLVEIYNRHLDADGFAIIQDGDISGNPIYSGRKKIIGEAHLLSKKREIKKYLNTEYVNSTISIMTTALGKGETDLAIGTAKELLEIACKSILKQKNIVIDTNWNLSRMLNETSKSLDFMPMEINEAEKAKKSIIQILGGISTIVQGVTELRNSYGTGHGKDADFKGLETKYAKLLVGVVSEIVIFYLTINGETVELVEN
jgi:hypothetical protein